MECYCAAAGWQIINLQNDLSVSAVEARNINNKNGWQFAIRTTSYIINLYLMRTLITVGTAVLLTCARCVSSYNYIVAFFLL